MRRVTWTFLSQHAQIIDYDGKRLLLGIATVGLVNTFRAGNHAELVRQALIDEIGVDVPVEGVPMPDAGSDRRAAASARGDQRSAPSRAPEPEPEPWPEPEADPWTQPGTPPDFVPTAEERSAAPPTSRPTVPPTDAPTTTPTTTPATTPTTRGSSAGTTATPDDSGAPSTTRPPARRPRAAPAPRSTPPPARADGLPPNGRDRSWRSSRRRRCGRPERLSGRCGERRRREHRDHVVGRPRRGRTGARRPVPRRARGLTPGPPGHRGRLPTPRGRKASTVGAAHVSDCPHERHRSATTIAWTVHWGANVVLAHRFRSPEKGSGRPGPRPAGTPPAARCRPWPAESHTR